MDAGPIRIDTNRGRGAAIAGLAGAIAGLLWGGLFGRIAMRITFLTSGEGVRGVITADGNEIGRFSSDTLGLLATGVLLGLIGGLVYGLARMLLNVPTRVATVTWAIAAGFGVGAVLVNTGVDFQILSPLWLTVGLFVVVPGGWGVTVVPLTERLLRTRIATSGRPTGSPRDWGTTGSRVAWVVLAAITVAGIIDLARDIATLT